LAVLHWLASGWIQLFEFKVDCSLPVCMAEDVFGPLLLTEAVHVAVGLKVIIVFKFLVIFHLLVFEQEFPVSNSLLFRYL